MNSRETTPGLTADRLPAEVDLAQLCAAFAGRLGVAGLAVPAERVAWWATAVLTARPTLVADLYWLGRVTLVDRPESLAGYDEIFGLVFGGGIPSLDRRPAPEPGEPPRIDHEPEQGGHTGNGAASTDEIPAMAALASEIEVLQQKDFAECSAEELAELARLVDRMRLVAPVRPSGWQRSRGSGRVIDLRRTLRDANRTGGDPINLRHRRRGTADRQLILLADVSGSMQAYSRIYLRVLQGAVVGAKAHAYVFATQLRPVTRALGSGRREDAIRRALAAAPDAAGGTRIGAAIQQFLDTDGRRGLARGAVVVIVSDGWERADPALLAEQMRRLALLAHRVIWVNPRK
ncbi:MAG: VWA domain-containing protein, partial [Nakamurella sp.]